MVKIKHLPKEFTRRGVRFTQIEKVVKEITDNVGNTQTEGYFIYKCNPLNYQYEYFEVFRYRLVKPHPLSGEDYDLMEYYPSDEMFGIYAWCCSNEDSLQKIMREKFGVDYHVKKDYKFSDSDKI